MLLKLGIADSGSYKTGTLRFEKKTSCLKARGTGWGMNGSAGELSFLSTAKADRAQSQEMEEKLGSNRSRSRSGPLTLYAELLDRFIHLPVFPNALRTPPGHRLSFHQPVSLASCLVLFGPQYSLLNVRDQNSTKFYT